MGFGSPGPGVKDYCKPLCGGGELNLDLLQEQHIFYKHLKIAKGRHKINTNNFINIYLSRGVLGVS